jgi:hypothetical protein
LAWLSVFASDAYSADYQIKRSRIIWAGWFLTIMGVSAVIALVISRLVPKPAVIAWMLYGIGIGVILYKPRYGLYMVLFFALLGDANLMPWYPFFKNFSSHESIFFLHNSLIINPLEVYLAITFISWLVRAVATRYYRVYLGDLFWPALIFSSFIVFGLVYGLARGGSVNIALWESRPILYIIIALVLASNLIVTRQQINILVWLLMSAILIKGIVGVYTVLNKLHSDLSSVNSLTEHSAAIHMDTMFILVGAAWLYRASVPKRYLLLAFLPFVVYTYIMAQRRAAFISLALALCLILILLFFENRKLFWRITPALVVVSLGYVAIFWHSSSKLALPAQALKSVIAPSQVDMRDQASNQYRVLENVNINFTIHKSPLTGVGFGRKFYIIVPMPDISTFTWWEYITHNSILWIWMKTGVFGFIALLYFIACAVIFGVRNLVNMPKGDMRAIALMAVTYVCMHFMYAYVDMSWDIQSMLYLGVALGLINSMERIAAVPLLPPARRWSWQKVAQLEK